MTFTLAHYFPYLLNRAGARIAGAFSAELVAFGVSLQAWRVLAVLLDATALKMGELARLTSIEVSTLTRVVDGMETHGLVRRRRDPEDARAVWVEASARGRATARKIVPLALRYEAIALEGFTPEEQAELEALLVRVFANMDRLSSPAGGAAQERGGGGRRISTTLSARARAPRTNRNSSLPG
jgi:DNA-binding MarR family transcriptional regulator